jgi:hypothetical protein
MRKSKFSDGQLLGILKEADAGVPVANQGALPAALHRVVPGQHSRLAPNHRASGPRGNAV